MRCALLLVSLAVIFWAAHAGLSRSVVDADDRFPAVALQLNPYNGASFQALGCNTSAIPYLYTGCTAFLIDSDRLLDDLGANFSTSVRTLLRRRLVSASAHCTRASVDATAPNTYTYPFDRASQRGLLSFVYNAVESPGRVTVGAGAQCATERAGNATVSWSDAPGFGVYPYHTLGVAQTYPEIVAPAPNDFALLVLDNPVNVIEVPDAALIQIAFSDYCSLRASQLAPLTTAGFGIVSLGDLSKDGLGAAITSTGNGVGARNRQYSELAVEAISQATIVASSSLPAADATAPCASDSGSPALVRNASSGRWLAYGMVSSGDIQCRAAQFITRIGTPHWRDWALRAIVAFASTASGNVTASQQVRSRPMSGFSNVAALSTVEDAPCALESHASPLAATPAATEAANSPVSIATLVVAAAGLLAVVLFGTAIYVRTRSKHRSSV